MLKYKPKIIMGIIQSRPKEARLEFRENAKVTPPDMLIDANIRVSFGNLMMPSGIPEEIMKTRANKKRPFGGNRRAQWHHAPRMIEATGIIAGSKEIKVPGDLRKQIEEAFEENPKSAWDEVIAELARDDHEEKRKRSRIVTKSPHRRRLPG